MIKNERINVETIKDHVGKLVLLGYGSTNHVIAYGWIGFLESYEFDDEENPQIDASNIKLSDCCTLINDDELESIENYGYDKQYVSNSQDSAYIPTEEQIKEWALRLAYSQKK